MTFQDEFIHRLRVVRGEETGGGGSGLEPREGRSDERNHPNPSFEKEGLESAGDGGEHIRHPEFISGPPEVEPEDRGERDGVLKRVQDDEDSSVRGDEDVQVQGEELTPPSRSREGPGVGLCETKSAGANITDTPTPSPSREREGDCTRHDGWHRELRVKFLEALAQTGNVQASAYFVQRTRQSAYDLKRR
ncbi:MAG: hypothetical protein V7679_10310, partial [Parasphingorhabdus sp.]